jgi:hypothetical protein
MSEVASQRVMSTTCSGYDSSTQTVKKLDKRKSVICAAIHNNHPLMSLNRAVGRPISPYEPDQRR